MSYSEYTPDCWVVVKSPKDGHLRVLGGWSGGYLGSDHWRLNSGIISATELEDNLIAFEGSSGSCYVCNKGSYRVSLAIGPTLNQLYELGWTLMDETTDWENYEYT